MGIFAAGSDGVKKSCYGRQMAARRALWGLAAFALVVVTGCGDSGTGPVIDSVTPQQAQRGAEVELLGDRFCGDGDDVADSAGVCATPPSGFVNFGIEDPVVRANVVRWLNDRITVTVPNSAPVGATVLVVTVSGVSSNAVDFDVQ